MATGKDRPDSYESGLFLRLWADWGKSRAPGVLTSAQISRILWVSSHNAAEKPRGSDQPEATTRTAERPGAGDCGTNPPAVKVRRTFLVSPTYGHEATGQQTDEVAESPHRNPHSARILRGPTCGLSAAPLGGAQSATDIYLLCPRPILCCSVTSDHRSSP